MDFRVSLRSRTMNWMKLRTVVSDLSGFWKDEGVDYVREWYRRLFATQGASSGRKWAAHRPATTSIRRRMGAKGGIGWHSGRLRNSLTRKNAAEGVRVVNKMSLRFGTDVNNRGYDYAQRFHTGGKVTKVFGRTLKRPSRQQARPLYSDPMPSAFTNPLRQKLDTWIQKRITQEGL